MNKRFDDPFSDFNKEFNKARKWIMVGWGIMVVVGIAGLSFVLYLAWLLVTHLIATT